MWPASAAQQAGWPGLAGPRCRCGHAQVKPARRHADRSLAGLDFNTGAEEGWEWDVGTTVTRTAAAAAGYLSAEVQESAVHRSTYYGYTYYGFA